MPERPDVTESISLTPIRWLVDKSKELRAIDDQVSSFHWTVANEPVTILVGVGPGSDFLEKVWANFLAGGIVDADPRNPQPPWQNGRPQEN